MTTFRKNTNHDGPAQLDELAASYQKLLTEALEIAHRRASEKPVLIREILATACVEGLASSQISKVAGVSFRAERYERTWHSLIPWQYLEDATAEELAESMIETVETNVHMTETDSWPPRPDDQEPRISSND